MSFVSLSDESLPQLNLKRDVTKHLKRGHLWIFANCFGEETPPPRGLCQLKFKGELIGIGIHDPESNLRFRMLCHADEPYFRKNSPQKTLQFWSDTKWTNALSLRRSLLRGDHNSFRLLNGEGDGVAGLIVDLYGPVAVIKLDQVFFEKIYVIAEVKDRLLKEFPHLKCVYLKRRNREEEKGEVLYGALPEETEFLENGIHFSTNIRDAAKTGFFLDQRDNRKLIQDFSENKEVLNLFSYTGGFSLFAAAGKAKKVTSVDIAKVAIEAVSRNFEINKFSTPHRDVAQDAFEFVQEELQQKKQYDLVITDPPSFAPNEKSVPQATAAYTKIFADSIRLVKENGFFAASSCSSHISTEAFLEICLEAFAKAGRRGLVVKMGSQPIDHPYPLAMPELRYLKFVLFQIHGKASR